MSFALRGLTHIYALRATGLTHIYALRATGADAHIRASRAPPNINALCVPSRCARGSAGVFWGERILMSKIRRLGHSPNARAMLEGIHSGIEVSLLFRPRLSNNQS